MDSIKSINLSSISVCNLNTKFNDRCHTDWSKSNLISIVTPAGVYILKPQLDKQDGPFRIDLISNPTTRFQHQTTHKFWPSFDTMWSRLSSQEYMEVFSDPALLTNVSNLSIDAYPRRYRQARWSPPIDLYPRECLLAVLTSDYQLIVFRHANDTWIAQADLSRDYDLIWSQLQLNKGYGEECVYENIRRNLLSLSICTFCWKESSKNNGPILLAATTSGDIVIWQVSMENYSEESQDNLDLMNVKVVIHTNIEYITAMQLYGDLLLMSARDGRVVLFDLTTTFNNLEERTQQTSKRVDGAHPAPKTLSLFTLEPTATIWDQDSIEVSDFYIQHIPKDAFRVVLAKSTNICWSINNYVKREDNSAATITLSSSFSGIDSLDPSISLHQSPATWLRPAGPNRAVLVAGDGSFFQVEFTEDGQDASPAFSAINTGNLNLSHMVPRGLCCSPNGHLVTMISCVNFMYDPFKLSAPSKLILVPTINDKKFLFECIQNLKDTNWLEEKRVTSPMDVCDYIDYLRSIFNLLGNQQVRDLYKTLKDALEEMTTPENEYQIVRLKILGFILMKLMESNHPNITSIGLKFDLNTSVRDVILRLEIEQILNNVFEGESEYTNSGDVKPHLNKLCNNLGDRQIQSLRNYFVWLKDSPDCDPLVNKYDEKFKSLVTKLGFSSIEEVCPICKDEINFVSLRHGTCRNQHRFERCARSLLIISLQSDDELVCEHCKCRYLAKSIWPTRNYWLCLFCQ